MQEKKSVLFFVDTSFIRPHKKFEFKEEEKKNIKKEKNRNV